MRQAHEAVDCKEIKSSRLLVSVRVHLADKSPAGGGAKHKTLNIRRRGPYHARHSSVTWQLMLGKNLLWVAKQHGHSVEVMLRMSAGSTAQRIPTFTRSNKRWKKRHLRALYCWILDLQFPL